MKIIDRHNLKDLYCILSLDKHIKAMKLGFVIHLNFPLDY